MQTKVIFPARIAFPICAALALLSILLCLPVLVHAALEAFIFDFEASAEKWEPSTKPGEQGMVTVYTTNAQAYHGLSSLAMSVHLDDSVADLRQGAAFVFLPGNMEGKTITAWVWCPSAAMGDSNHPDGVQLFVKDQQFRSQYGPWRNLGSGVPLNRWTEIELTPSRTNPPGGYTDPGFDPTRVMIVGIKLGAGSSSQVPFQGTCYLDFVHVYRTALVVPASDHMFDFNSLTPEQQRDKPFGHGPYWDMDPGWGASAWYSDDITVRDGQLAITATFDLSNPDASRKGYVGVELKPSLDINNKSNRVIRAEVKFDPYVGPEDMLATIYVYDRRDGRPDCQSNPGKWYRSRDMWVGGSIWNELVFDLNDPSHFYTDAAYLQFSDIASRSLKNILKVGIQFYANQPYTGTIYLDNVTIGGTEILTNFVNLNRGFVTRQGSQLALNCQSYRFAGDNVYYLFYKSHYMIDDVLETMQRNGIGVVRTWGFSDGKAPYAADGDGIPNGNEGSAFQPEPRLYYEPTFVNFDYVIRSAGEHGVRLIIPLVNHWSDKDVAEGQNSFGGMSQYLEWCGVAEYGAGVTITNKARFYTDTCTINLYEGYIATVLNRRNTLTGVRYKDDPTILAWELANEPRCQAADGCPTGPDGQPDATLIRTWAYAMSDYIKNTLHARQLVALGDEGLIKEPGSSDEYYNGHYGVDWEENLAVPSLDFGTVHLYPETWGNDSSWATAWITSHISLAEQDGKPVIFEEYGVHSNRDLIYRAWTDLFKAGADGDCVWMIAGQVNGCNEDHVPIGSGFYYPDYDGFTFWEPTTSTMQIIREHAAQMASNQTSVGCCYLPLILRK
jgi:mannan endo-1,4-beta-mannosidase